MPKRYRLLARAQLHGAVRDPGYVFTLEDGELGPHRTVVASDHGAAVGGHYRIGGEADKVQELKDVPLYEEIQEEEPAQAEDEEVSGTADGGEPPASEDPVAE